LNCQDAKNAKNAKNAKKFKINYQASVFNQHRPSMTIMDRSSIRFFLALLASWRKKRLGGTGS